MRCSTPPRSPVVATAAPCAHPRALALALGLLFLLCTPLQAGAARGAVSHDLYPKRTNLTLFHINSFDGDAVCNDGSAGAYYFSQAPSADYADVWLVYLGGRDWCFDLQSCLQRQQTKPAATSSRTWPDTVSLSGLFSPQFGRNPLAGANKAFLGYCSSDAWQGDAAPSAATGNLAFRGQRIVRATLAALVAQHGLGSSYLRGGKPDRVLLAGGAAGGRGGMLLVDALSEWLTGFAGVAAGAVTVQGLFDSALWLPVQPLGTPMGGSSLALQAQRSVSLFNSTGLMAPACLARYTVPTVQWQCLFPSTALQFVTSSYLLVQPQFDKRQLGFDLHGKQPPFAPSGPQATYAVQLAQALRTASLPALSGSNALFSAACYKAATTLTPQLWGVRAAVLQPQPPTLMGRGPPGAMTASQVLNAWFFGGGVGPSVSAQDTCSSGFACGSYCRLHAARPRAGKASALSAASRSAAHRRRSTIGLVVLLVVLPAGCATMLTYIIPVRPSVRLSDAERLAAAEGTPLVAVAPPQVRSSLQRWAEEEAEAKRRSRMGSRTKLLTSFYDGDA